uniref:Uncharacterized protein n=1 Tax=Timema shepardi TaxID=629360 RepID=A0A7R9B6A8_TIMSH|nr:unnamed protein product [Timema shepardi]
MSGNLVRTQPEPVVVQTIESGIAFEYINQTGGPLRIKGFETLVADYRASKARGHSASFGATRAKTPIHRCQSRGLPLEPRESGSIQLMTSFMTIGLNSPSNLSARTTGAQVVELNSSVFLDVPLEGNTDTGPHNHQIQPQMLPVGRIRCGMWASFALATVFVAGAKFYFDHQFLKKTSRNSDIHTYVGGGQTERASERARERLKYKIEHIGCNGRWPHWSERARLKDRTVSIFQARALDPVQSSLQALGNIINHLQFIEPSNLYLPVKSYGVQRTIPPLRSRDVPSVFDRDIFSNELGSANYALARSPVWPPSRLRARSHACQSGRTLMDIVKTITNTLSKITRLSTHSHRLYIICGEELCWELKKQSLSNPADDKEVEDVQEEKSSDIVKRVLLSVTFFEFPMIVTNPESNDITCPAPVSGLAYPGEDLLRLPNTGQYRVSYTTTSDDLSDLGVVVVDFNLSNIPMVSACKQAIPIKRLPYVGEDSAKTFCSRKVTEISLTPDYRLNSDTAGRWEVALAEFQHPCSFTTVPEGQNIVWYNWVDVNGVEQTFKDHISPGNYSTIHELIKALNDVEALKGDSGVVFKYTNPNKKASKAGEETNGIICVDPTMNQAEFHGLLIQANTTRDA